MFRRHIMIKHVFHVIFASLQFGFSIDMMQFINLSQLRPLPKLN